NLILNWVIPFFALVPANTKRNPRVLAAVAITILCGRWLDLYLLITPELWSKPNFGLFELGTAAGYAALIVLLVARNISLAPLVPVNDPILAAEELYELGVRP